ncbi:MAG: leucine-rich repeat protein [Bacillota bacterium]|nr:leucine-rich repeat protein [Bacillota bacterium]MDW7676635.1 leucine-rich repeat protein [Bacillota bacterium]
MRQWRFQIKRKGRKGISILMVVLLLLSSISTAAATADEGHPPGTVAFTMGQQGFAVDGVWQQADVTPYLQNNRVMVPLRYAAEALGARVDWEAEHRRVTVTREEDVITLTIGSRQIMKNGVLFMEMDTEAVIMPPGRTMVPLSRVAAALEVPYTWDGSTRTAYFMPSVEVDTYIEGGGADSIYINGGEYGNIIIRNTPEGGTRIVATNVEGLEVIVATTEPGEVVILEGVFSRVTVEASEVTIKTQGDTWVDELLVTETGTDFLLNLSENTTIGLLNTENDSTKVEGTGTIEEKSGPAQISETVMVIKDNDLPASTSSTPVSSGGGGGGGGGTGGTPTPDPPSQVTYTLTLTGDGIVANPSAGSVAANTSVTVTITPPSGKQVAAFTLNGTSKKTELLAAPVNQYTFAINANTTVAVTYENIPTKSVYDILFDPSGLVAGVGKEVGFTLKAVEVRNEGYDRVRINVELTEKPADSTASLIGNYGTGPVNVIELGYWGPEEGHAVSKNYDMTYPLIARFTKPGQYTIKITLRDLDEDTDILTKTVVITVLDYTQESYFTFDESTNTITDYHPTGVGGGLPELLDVAIPSTINNVPVSIIGNNAFRKKGLTTAIIPDSVITIGELAFAENDLTSVSIGDGVITIGKSAFEYNRLTHVTIGNSVKIIDDSAFYRGGYETLSNLIIPDSVETIGKYAFHMNGLTSITIGSSVKTIGESALYGNKLTNITLPASLTSIGPRALMDNSLNTITIGANVTIGNTLLRLHSDGKDGNLFRDAYEAAGKTAGTYTGTQQGVWMKLAVKAPPVLNEDTTQNYAGQTLMITFSDGQAWANAITEVSVDGEILSLLPDNIQYHLNTGDEVLDGQISLYGSKIKALTSPGSKEIRVKSTGYTDAVVMQDITATYFDRAAFTSQPAGPGENGGLLATQPVVTLYDKYNNPCTDGPSSTREITLQAKTGSSWTLGGTVTANAVNGVVAFTDLTATHSSGVAITDAQLMYEVIGSPNKSFYSESFTIPGATGLAAPTLTADITDNYAGANITITLQSGNWSDWISAISAVKVGNDTLTSSAPGQYNLGEGILTLLTENITQLQKPGTYSITVEASGYNNAVVNQVVTAGLMNSAQFTIQPQGPSVSGGQLQRQPVVTLRDTYGNECADGPSNNASVTLQRAAGDSWTLGGTNKVTAVNGVATFTDLTATNPSGAAITDARMGYTYQGVTTYSESFSIPGAGSQLAPELTADTTDNYAGNIIEITFVDDPVWRDAVNSIIIRTNIQIIGEEGVTLEAGKLVLDTSKIQGLQELGNHHVSIGAKNYAATDTYQTIKPGLATVIEIDTQPVGPTANGGYFTTPPRVKLKDAYNNECIQGPSATAEVSVEEFDGGVWTLGGTTTRVANAGIAYFADLTATNGTESTILNAQLRFTLEGSSASVVSNEFSIPVSEGYTLTLEVFPDSGAGGTATTPEGTSSGVFLEGFTVRVTAQPNVGYEFAAWSRGDVNGPFVSSEAVLDYTMPGDDTILVATFNQLYQLTLEAAPTNGGTVTLEGGVTSNYFQGYDKVTVTAVANEGYTFHNWTRDGFVVSTAASYDYQMDGRDTTLVANFVLEG